MDEFNDILAKNKSVNIVIDAEDFIRLAHTIAATTAEEVLLKHQEKVYTREEVCKTFNISYGTLNRWEHNGLIEGIRLGRRKYFKEAEVKKVLSERG